MDVRFTPESRHWIEGVWDVRFTPKGGHEFSSLSSATSASSAATKKR